MEWDVGSEVRRKPATEFMADPALVFVAAKEIKKPALQTRRQIISLEHLSIYFDEQRVQYRACPRRLQRARLRIGDFWDADRRTASAMSP